MNFEFQNRLSVGVTRIERVKLKKSTPEREIEDSLLRITAELEFLNFLDERMGVYYPGELKNTLRIALREFNKIIDSTEIITSDNRKTH